MKCEEELHEQYEDCRKEISKLYKSKLINSYVINQVKIPEVTL